MSDEQEKFAGEAEADRAEPEAETLVLDVGVEDAGARLDAFLAARVEGVSRSILKRVIEDGEVLVGGRAAKPSLKLKGGERVEVELPAPPPSEVEPEEIPLDILHEDEEVVVVNKPAGLVVHPAAGVHSGTLANALAFHLGQLAGGGSLRPGIVHRLDRDTSGVIVVAKTARAHESLSEQFRERTVFKSYVALVHGVTREERGRIEEPLARDPRNRTRMAVVRSGRAALSLWRVRQHFTRFTLLDVQIKTGRTHQIRVHLAWIKHPVVGDETYGGGRDKTLPDPALRARVNALGRQFLHAERLGFHHPSSGEWLSFTAPLPPELSEFLDALQ
ncbi:MAG: RluA family pseudouridine synthase [Acidobacteria bacterium]|nr:RluA family pseudouridine synthase [Acidobacteriota bacterium]